MGRSRTCNFMLQVQMKDEPEGSLTIISADKGEEIDIYKHHIGVRYLYIWPQTAYGKRFCKGFDYLKMENGTPTLGCYVGFYEGTSTPIKI